MAEVKKQKKFFKKEEKYHRINSGVPGFDSLIEGGFESESINLVVGGSGSGKTIFALQFLLEGVKKGESVLYVTFEEKKSEFYNNMKILGWDLEKLENSGKFFFLEYSPEKVKVTLEEGGGTIESLVLKNKVKRLVIDSITSFSFLFEGDFSKKQANLGLFDIINKWDCTTLLTVQSDPSKKESSQTIDFEVDGIINLYFNRIGKKRQRVLEILKMRGTNHSKEMHAFEIKKGGITVKKGAVKKAIKLLWEF